MNDRMAPGVCDDGTGRRPAAVDLPISPAGSRSEAIALEVLTELRAIRAALEGLEEELKNATIREEKPKSARR